MSIAGTFNCRKRNLSAPSLYPDPSTVSSSRERSHTSGGSYGNYKKISMPNTFSPLSRGIGTFRHEDYSLDSNELVTINVSGRRYQTYITTLQRFPTSLLGDPMKRKHFYRPNTKEYFFDRHRKAFDGILYYYQSDGDLVCPPGVPENIFTQEILYFEIEHSIEDTTQDVDDTIELPKNPFLSHIWVLFEKPNSSVFAKVVAVFSITIIVLSIVVFCLETLPEMNPENNSDMEGIWNLLNTICNSWFTIEYVLRFIASPKKIVFLRSAVNFIDLLSILPFYLTMGIGSAGGSSIAVLRVIRVIRVIRIFKLTRHSRGLHVLGNTIKASFRELLMLALFLAIAIILFSSAVYFAEHHGNGNHDFKSIPHSFWWAVITMSTVGYGDLAPKTLIGKLIGTLCAVSGVLVIALPVPVIVSNFERFYKEEQVRQAREDEITKKENEEASFGDMRKSIQMMTDTSIILAGGVKRDGGSEGINLKEANRGKSIKERLQDQFSFTIRKPAFNDIEETCEEIQLNGEPPFRSPSLEPEDETSIILKVPCSSPVLNNSNNNNNTNGNQLLDRKWYGMCPKDTMKDVTNL